MKKFLSKNDGHVAVTFALLGIPLALAGTLALDSYAAQGEHSKLQAALDSAVLAAVSNGTLTTSADRESYARDRFASNYAYPANLTFADDGMVVTMTAHSEYSTMLGGMINKQTLDIQAESAGTLSQGRTVCVLGLAEEGESVVSFADSAYFQAHNCSVQVNSSDDHALVTTSTNIPRAESFCVNGGASGNFEPLVNSQCEVVADPYANVTAPEPGECRDTTQFTYIESGVPTDHPQEDPNWFGRLQTAVGDDDDDDVLAINTIDINALGNLAIDYLTYEPVAATSMASDLTGIVITDNTTLEPGTYCEKLIIDGYNVDFPAGDYHFIKGARFLNGSEVRADNVTIILEGAHTSLEIDTGAELHIKAPADGALSGIAIIQTPYEYERLANTMRLNLVRTYGDTTQGFAPFTEDEAYSYLRSGGRLDVIGTVYLPQQALEVSGDSVFGAQAQSTSFIAHKVQFKDRMHANIRVDHQAEGLPPVEPRVETSPRLIK